MKRKKQKDILIIGSNSAIMSESINNFLKKDINVIGVSRNSANKKFLKNINYIHYKMDLLKNFKNIGKLFKKIKKKHKNIGVIIYAQGGTLGEKKIFTDIQNWEKLWKINFGCSIIINNLFLKDFIKKKYGRILYFNSVATYLKSGSATYSSSKICINDYVKKMGNNFSHLNIFINSITTSIVSAKGNNWSKFELKSSKKAISNILQKNISSQKFGRSNYFTEIVDLLCSSRNKFITASNLDLDGGFLK